MSFLISIKFFLSYQLQWNLITLRSLLYSVQVNLVKGCIMLRIWTISNLDQQFRSHYHIECKIAFIHMIEHYCLELQFIILYCKTAVIIFNFMHIAGEPLDVTCDFSIQSISSIDEVNMVRRKIVLNSMLGDLVVQKTSLI